jgi:hypothetical protein
MCVEDIENRGFGRISQEVGSGLIELVQLTKASEKNPGERCGNAQHDEKGSEETQAPSLGVYLIAG